MTVAHVAVTLAPCGRRLGRLGMAMGRLRRIRCMKSFAPFACGALFMLAAPAQAQTASAAVASQVDPAASAARAAEPSSSTRIAEDDRVRITETRVRGQLQRITVRSKLTGQDYEIIVGPGGRDPSQTATQRADSAGQRAWSIFQF